MNYRKIDIYVNNHYFRSSTWYKTCREAIQSCKNRYKDITEKDKITANFAEKKN